MDTPTIWRYVASAMCSVATIFSGVVWLVGCATETRGTQHGRAFHFEDPNAYVVDPAHFPQYRAERDMVPPYMRTLWGEPISSAPMPKILKTDVWWVHYKVSDLLLIYSPQYQDRICRRFSGRPGSNFVATESGCKRSDYFVHARITQDGTVVGGWIQIKNPERVLIRADRRVVLRPDRRFDSDWGAQPLFQIASEN